MDNLAHALVGAALGRAVADRKVTGAAWIGALAANAPDLSELMLHPAAWTPGPSYLVYHRGITHSFLGAALETLALTGAVGLVAWWRARGARGPRPAWGPITLCVGAAVASHLWLDWQGSYGLRPFLPWDARWYYGDWVAIVDPFFWMVPLVALAWGAERHWVPALGVVATLAVVTTFVLAVGRGVVAPGVRVLVVALVLLCVVGWIEHWFGVAGRRRAAAGAALLLVAYAAVSGAASAVVKARARTAARHRFGPGASSAALTVVGHPFHWETVVASPESIAGPGWAIARHLATPAVRQALATPSGRAIAGFARFLAADVDSASGRLEVYLWDARFRTRRGDRGGFAAVAVRLR